MEGPYEVEHLFLGATPASDRGIYFRESVRKVHEVRIGSRFSYASHRRE